MSNRRSEEILFLVNAKGSISIHELAEKTFASRSTVRRELEKLEMQGLLRRYHGGAESLNGLCPPRIIRFNHNQEQKKIIGEKAARLVAPGSTIFIDASTTAQYMLPHLSSIKNLTIYTNGIDTAIRLGEANVRAISTGGEVFAQSMAYVGTVAIDTVQKIHFDAMFFSSAGFNETTISDWSEAETALRRIVIKQSRKRYFLADHTKQGKSYTHIICHVNDLDKIISE